TRAAFACSAIVCARCAGCSMANRLVKPICGTLSVDLSAPSTRLADDEPFHLRCDLDEAGARLQRVVELGYDDALLTNLNHTVADITETDLANLRSLVARA